MGLQKVSVGSSGCATVAAKGAGQGRGGDPKSSGPQLQDCRERQCETGAGEDSVLADQ